MNVLILGASARSAAFSALRAGLQPAAADLFADRDLAAICPASRVPADFYPQGLAALVERLPPGPWIYTGALENEPELVDRIAAQRPLWGNGAATLRAVRDPLAVATVLCEEGLPAPAVQPSSAGLPRDGNWLVKPVASAGGQGIRPLDRDEPDPQRPCYYQERVAGETLSAVYLGARAGATLAGVTKQLIGRPGADFAYTGSVGPWPVSADEERRIEKVGAVLASAFGLFGLFGVDFVLKDGHPWVVEVNPRYTASVEVIELLLGRALLVEHCQVFEPTSPDVASSSRGVVPRFLGKRIIFAACPCRFPDLRDWEPRCDPFLIPEIADVPSSGTVFEPGDPVLTVFATGSSLALCAARLARAARRWERRLRAQE